MSVWINEDGLKPEDAAVILARQVNLSHFGNYEFASQFVNAIGEQCKTALAARKRQDEEKARLAEQQATAGKRATPEELAAFRAGIAKFGVGEIASSS